MECQLPDPDTHLPLILRKNIHKQEKSTEQPITPLILKVVRKEPSKKHFDEKETSAEKPNEVSKNRNEEIEDMIQYI